MPSENGWNPSWASQELLEWVEIPGTQVQLQFQKGFPSKILGGFAADYHAYVEPLRNQDSASYTPTNSVATSNHLNGTAMDLNWDSHPFHAKGTFNQAQMRTIRELLEFYEGCVFWAGDWASPIDEMHWQMGYNTFNPFKGPDCGSFIKRKLRADGYSKFRRGDTTAAPKDTRASILEAATGVSAARAAEILPALREGLVQSECLTLNRIAMWLAQIGHESDGFKATEEYADGDKRTDRWKYKGRTWIQITWRTNYAQFSEWCSGKGLVLSDTEFVDNPNTLADLKWAGIGPAWYWTVARPDINRLSDDRDIVAVTQRINGGQNGIADRRARFERALRVGDKLIELAAGEDDLSDVSDLIQQIHAALFDKRASESIYRTKGEGPRWRVTDLIGHNDAWAHQREVEVQASEGNLDELARVVRVAQGFGASTETWAVERAQRLLADIEEANPEFLQALIEREDN